MPQVFHRSMNVFSKVSVFGSLFFLALAFWVIMAFTYQVPSLLMEWCLDCHRHPEREIRPRQEVFNMKYTKPADQEALGRRLTEAYKIKDPTRLTSCSVCHR